MHGSEQHTEFAGREALALKPFEVGDRQSCDCAAFVFAKGHFERGELAQYVGVGHHATSRIAMLR